MRNSNFSTKQFQITLTKYSFLLVILSGSIALSVILGWIFHVESLVRIFPNLATMKFNTALCFIFLSGSSLLSHKSFFSWQPKISRLLINIFTIIVLTIATLTLIQYIFNLNLDIDQLFFEDSFPNTGGVKAVKSSLGRMGFNTAFCFLILALVTLSLNLRHPLYFLAHILSCVVLLIALLAFLGLIDNTAYFNGVEAYTDMALHTSLNFIIFSISILFHYPHRGIMKIITNDTFGGSIARNILPMIILLSPLLCGLVLIGYQQNIYSVAMGFNLLAILYIATFTTIIWQNSYFLDRIDTKRKQAENLLNKKQQQLIKQNESLIELNQQRSEEIKKRQKFEIILRESEAQYLAIIEDQTELICRFLPDGTLLFVNKAYCKYYGVIREEVIGTKYLPVIYPEDLPKIKKMLNSLSIENPVATIEHRGIVKGKIRWMQWVNRAIFDEEGNFIEFQSVGRDIHDRKQAEMKLQNLNHQLQSLLDYAPLSICLFDENGRYLEVNKTFTNSLNLSSEKIIGKTFEDLLPEFLCITFRKRLEILKNTLQPLDIEDEIIIDDQIQIFRSVLFPVMEDSHTTKIFWAIAYNITKQKQIEQKMEKSLQEKEVLLKEIHHRVKNNLQVINSLLNLQSRSIEDSSIRLRFKESQTRIHSMALIHEHLYQSNNLSEINFSQYIKELVNVLFSSYKINTLTIDVEINIEKNFFLSIDSAIPCGLIINELISNVLKYAFDEQAKPKLFIGITTDDDENLVLSIEDNGKGLPPELDWETTTTLGLRLVKNLTNQLRGNIQLDTKQGTKWTITLNQKKPE